MIDREINKEGVTAVLVTEDRRRQHLSPAGQGMAHVVPGKLRSGLRAAVGGLLAACLARGVSAAPLQVFSEGGDAAAVQTAPGATAMPPNSDIVARARARGLLTLEDAYRIAVVNNERVSSAREAYVQAEMLRRIARSAVLPQISLEDTYYRQNAVDISSTSTGVSFSSERNETALQLVQPIFSGFRDRNYLAFSKENIQASRYGIDNSARRLYGDVAAAFYTVLRAEAEVRTLQDSVRLETSRLEEISSRREVGLARKTDVLLAQSQLSDDIAQLTRARNDAVVSRQRLGFLTGVTIDLPLEDEVALPDAAITAAVSEAGPPAAVGPAAGVVLAPRAGTPSRAAHGLVTSGTAAPQAPDGAAAPEVRGGATAQQAPAGTDAPQPAAAPGENPANPSSMTPSPSGPGATQAAAGLDAIRQEALVRRVDLRELDSLVEAQRHLVSVARGEYFPNLHLEANYFLNRWNYSTFQQATDWTVEVMASIPLFDGGRARADVATAQSLLRQAMLDRSAAARGIELEVQDVWSTLQSDLVRLRTLEDRVRTAEETFGLIQEEYRNGIATNLEVLTAQNQLLSGRIDLERQRYQAKLDWVGLELVRGRLPAESLSDAAAHEDRESRLQGSAAIPGPADVRSAEESK